MLTHDVGKGRTYIAPGIQNDTIFNQDVLFKAKDVIITEGITDCIAFHQYGFSAISPVTVRFRKKDADVIERLLRKDQTIYMSNDNDFNAAGEDGAFDTAVALSLKGFTVKMITIPLEEKQKNARNKLDALEK